MSTINVDVITERTIGVGVTVESVLLKDGAMEALRIAQEVLAPTYGVTIAVDAAAGGLVKITVTDGVAFTISAPTNPVAGQTLAFDIVNSSGGAMGAITWDAVFKLAGAFTNPADTFRRTIVFYYDGTNWVELSRAGADI